MNSKFIKASCLRSCVIEYLQNQTYACLGLPSHTGTWKLLAKWGMFCVCLCRNAQKLNSACMHALVLNGCFTPMRERASSYLISERYLTIWQNQFFVSWHVAVLCIAWLHCMLVTEFRHIGFLVTDCMSGCKDQIRSDRMFRYYSPGPSNETPDQKLQVTLHWCYMYSCYS